MLLAEEHPLPLVDSSSAESPGYVVESNQKEDPEEYEDDETEDGSTLRITSTQELIDVVTAALPSPLLPPLPPPLYIPPPVARDPARAVPKITPMTLGEVNTKVTELAELHEHDTQDLYALLKDAQDSRTRISQRVTMDSQRVDLLMEDSIAHQETILIVDEEAYTHHQVHETHFQIQQGKIEELREDKRRRQAQMGTKGMVGLTRCIEKMESVFQISSCAIENQVKFATCTLLDAALTWWNSQIRSLGPDAYSMTWEIDKYISGLPDNIYGSVKSSKPKTLDETIKLANDFTDQKLCTYAERQTNNKRKADDLSKNNHENSYDVELADGKIVGVNTIMRGCTLNFLNHPFNIDLMPIELGSFDVIIGMDWLRRCYVVVVCDEKLVRVPYGNETLIFHGDEINDEKEYRLTIISCSKAQEYMVKGCQIFLAQIYAKKEEEKSERKQLKDVKGKQEKDKIGTKPDKNEKHGKARQCRRPITIKKERKMKKIQKLEEDLVTYFQNFQNTSESSDDSTNVINAPREPVVVKQDHGVNPPHIDECCCECGDALDGIFCQQCTCKSYGKGAHIGYNCPPKVPIISNPEPCNQTMNNELPQTLPSFDATCYSDKENSVSCVSKPNFVDESSNIFIPPPQPPIYYCEFCGGNAQYGHYCTPQASFINPEPGYSQDFNFPQDIYDFQQQYLCCDQSGGPHETFQCQQNRPAFYDDDDDDDVDYTIAITPVLSIKEPVNSLSIGDKHLDTILAMESDEVIKSSVKDLVLIPSEFEGIPDTMCDVRLVNNPTPLEAKDHFEIVINSNDDISSSDDESLYKENIEYVEASPHDSELVSLEAAEIVIPEVEEIKDDSLQINSGSTTTHSDISLPDYEAFYFDDDHIEEISSGSTTTHSYVSLSEYDSFIFDLANDQFPPTDRSDLTHEELADELAHIISPLEYDCFYIRNFPDPVELMSILNSEIRENLSSTTCVNLPIEDDHSPLCHMLYGSFLLILRIPLFLLIFTHSGIKILSLTQASPLIVFIHLSQVYLIGVELSRNSILTVVT
uniref:Reverse transcriptase domain-containing protein n=1 Tax=Tanacetum cinerariifolium TaxID=118510 RepID=A0A6L2LEJ6_TANCI|nr:reverse transcriptase domain-containing protein [Tanacetum cinerariifolium]